MISKIKIWLIERTKEIFSITFNLFKLMIPIIILVKVIEELGGIEYLATALEPMMQLVGLPASMGLVWATTMITNIYGGMIIFISTSSETLTGAQITVLACMMLIAHALPIEVRIAQKAGVRVLFTLTLRIGGALLLGFLLHQFYSLTDTLSEPTKTLWNPEIIIESSYISWAINQLETLFQVFLIIAALVVFLNILKKLGIEKLLALTLKPLLKVIGLSEKTTSISIIGVTLGLTYGGGLLINESKKGNIPPIDIFGSLSLLALSHSLIEDTILLLLLGADLTAILAVRLIFSLILITLIIRVVRQLNQTTFTRYCVYPTMIKK